MLIDLSVNYFLYNLLHSLVYKMSENHWKKAQEYIFTMTVFFWATAENTKILSMQGHKHRKAANPHVWTAAAIRCVWHFGLKHKEIRFFLYITHTCFSDQLCARVCVCVSTHQVFDDLLYLGLSLLHLLCWPLQTDALLAICELYMNLHTHKDEPILVSQVSSATLLSLVSFPSFMFANLCFIGKYNLYPTQSILSYCKKKKRKKKK